jgi:hypothetical protein
MERKIKTAGRRYHVDILWRRFSFTTTESSLL